MFARRKNQAQKQQPFSEASTISDINNLGQKALIEWLRKQNKQIKQNIQTFIRKLYEDGQQQEKSQMENGYNQNQIQRSDRQLKSQNGKFKKQYIHKYLQSSQIESCQSLFYRISESVCGIQESSQSSDINLQLQEQSEFRQIQLLTQLNLRTNQNLMLSQRIRQLQKQLQAIRSKKKQNKKVSKNIQIDIEDVKNLISVYFSKLQNSQSKFRAFCILKAHLNKINM